MPAKESQKEDWKAQRTQVAKAKDLPPADPAIVKKKPLSPFEESMQQIPATLLPQAGSRVLQLGGEHPATSDPGWMDQQGEPLDYLLRLMVAGQKDTEKTRSHRPLTGKRGKRPEKDGTYRERLKGLFGGEKP